MNYKRAVLLKYGEVVLKGFNKRSFEELMISDLRRRLKKIGAFAIEREQSTLVVYAIDGASEGKVDDAYAECRYVFGVASISIAAVVEKNMDAICECLRSYVAPQLAGCGTFKCEARRSDKSFPLTTPQIVALAGGAILEAAPALKVDLHSPKCVVTIEIRDNGAFVRFGGESGAGGLPLGCSGEGLLLLSGGIDSPVAGYMMAKRGLKLTALHFTSFPYTSARAMEKARTLSEIVGHYAGDIEFITVNLAHIQESINAHCMEDYHIIILRRFMMEIACRVAQKKGLGCVITGESLGQVASQTMRAISCVDVIADRPVFRPLIGMDKQEITDIAQRIGSFETSILPLEDCCTVFTPRHPITKPRLEQVLTQEQPLDRPALIEQAMGEAEIN